MRYRMGVRWQFGRDVVPSFSGKISSPSLSLSVVLRNTINTLVSAKHHQHLSIIAIIEFPNNPNYCKYPHYPSYSELPAKNAEMCIRTCMDTRSSGNFVSFSSNWNTLSPIDFQTGPRMFPRKDFDLVHGQTWRRMNSVACPDGILLHILSFLSAEDLLRSLLVGKLNSKIIIPFRFANVGIK